MENWTGLLRLAVRKKQNKTIPVDVYNQGAFKLTPPIYLDGTGQPCFYLMNPGGGYVDGDRYKAEIRVGEDAQMLLTTQSSTKIYKTINRQVIQETDIYLEKGSFLEYMPDPIIAYEHAQYLQTTVVRMERGSVIIYGDIITPGWSPDGSLFRYRRQQIKTYVYLEDELVVYDHLLLRPGEYPMEGLGRLEGYTHLGSMMVIGERATSDFIESINEVLVSSAGTCNIGLSALMIPGFSLRVLASSTKEVETVFETCQRFIRDQWFDKKPISFRKY